MQGQGNIRELALAAFSALEDAELDEALEEIHARVLSAIAPGFFEPAYEKGMSWNAVLIQSSNSSCVM